MDLSEEVLQEFIRRYNPYYKDLKTKIKEISQKFSKISLVLDAGAGKGLHSQLCKHLSKNGSTIVGLDILTSELKNNEIVSAKVIGDLNSLPFKNAVFDLVTLEWVIEHLEKPIEVLREIRRVLKTNYFLFISTPNILNPLVFLGSRLLPFNLSQKLHRLIEIKEKDIFLPKFKCNSPMILNKMLEATKFEKTITTAQNPHYLKFNKMLFTFYILLERLCAKLSIYDMYILVFAKKRR